MSVNQEIRVKGQIRYPEIDLKFGKMVGGFPGLKGKRFNHGHVRFTSNRQFIRGVSRNLFREFRDENGPRVQEISFEVAAQRRLQNKAASRRKREQIRKENDYFMWGFDSRKAQGVLDEAPWAKSWADILGDVDEAARINGLVRKQ